MNTFTRMVCLLLAGLLLTPTTARAQSDTCEQIVETALQLTEAHCQTTERNQLCYGSVLLQVEAQPGSAIDPFDEPGDLVDIAAVQRLVTSPMDIEAATWGVALLRVQATLPDTLPGQNVTFLLFGDTELLMPHEPEESIEGEPGLHMFTFRSGIGDARCAEAPNSGLLIETPQGAGEITLTLNAVEIHLASHAFLQAEADHELVVNVLSGRARVAALGEMTDARANMRVRVPLDADLNAAGPPSPPEACVSADLEGLRTDFGDCETVSVVLDEDCPVMIPAGMDVVLNNGFGFETREDAEEAFAPDVAAILIDGTTVIDRVNPIQPTVDEPNIRWLFQQHYEWQDPEPGTHIVTGPGPHGSHIGLGATRTCEITVLGSTNP